MTPRRQNELPVEHAAQERLQPSEARRRRYDIGPQNGISTKDPHTRRTPRWDRGQELHQKRYGCRTTWGRTRRGRLRRPGERGGAARSRAKSDEAIVPKIIGAAPNTPATGSHTDVQTKGRPKALDGRPGADRQLADEGEEQQGERDAKAVSAPRYRRSPTFAPAAPASAAPEPLPVPSGA